MILPMKRDALDGVLTVKVPIRWIELLDGMGNPDEKDRGRVVRKILREGLIAAGRLREDEGISERAKPGEHRARRAR
jgi:hypothetical protein